VQDHLRAGRSHGRRPRGQLRPARPPGDGKLQRRSGCRLPAPVDPLGAIYGLEQLRTAGEALGSAQEKEPAGAQRVVEEADDLALDLVVQVDEQVPAGDDGGIGGSM
jgi:hypothetical protein